VHIVKTYMAVKFCIKAHGTRLSLWHFIPYTEGHHWQNQDPCHAEPQSKHCFHSGFSSVPGS